jgi:hypothetical protein
MCRWAQQLSRALDRTTATPEARLATHKPAPSRRSARRRGRPPGVPERAVPPVAGSALQRREVATPHGRPPLTLSVRYSSPRDHGRSAPWGWRPGGAARGFGDTRAQAGRASFRRSARHRGPSRRCRRADLRRTPGGSKLTFGARVLRSSARRPRLLAAVQQNFGQTRLLEVKRLALWQAPFLCVRREVAVCG